jgi:hypothetical protein
MYYVPGGGAYMYPKGHSRALVVFGQYREWPVVRRASLGL